MPYSGNCTRVIDGKYCGMVHIADTTEQLTTQILQCDHLVRNTRIRIGELILKPKLLLGVDLVSYPVDSKKPLNDLLLDIEALVKEYLEANEINDYDIYSHLFL